MNETVLKSCKTQVKGKKICGSREISLTNFCFSSGAFFFVLFRVYPFMHNMENGNLELDGTFPDRHVPVSGQLKLLYYLSHYNNTSLHLNAIYHDSMNSIFVMKMCNTFPIYGPNIDCGCLLEPPH